MRPRRLAQSRQAGRRQHGLRAARVGEAGVPLDRARVSAFEEEALRVVSAPRIPEKARAEGFYDIACYYALRGSPDTARNLLRDAFRMDPELVEYSRTDDELVSIRDDLDALAG